MCKLFCLLLLVEIYVVQATLEEKDLGTKLQELAKILHNTCVDKSGTNEATIGKIINGDFVNDPKIKSYMKCLLQESTAMTDQGELNKEVMINLLPPDLKQNGVKVLEKCLQQSKDISDLDEKSFTFFKCIYDNNPANFIFF